MQIRLTTSRVNDAGQAEQFGDVIDVSRDEAKRLLAAGQAQLAPAAAAPETAMRAGGKPRSE